MSLSSTPVRNHWPSRLAYVHEGSVVFWRSVSVTLWQVGGAAPGSPGKHLPHVACGRICANLYKCTNVQVARLQSVNAAKLQGCKIAKLQCCNVAQLQSCNISSNMPSSPWNRNSLWFACGGTNYGIFKDDFKQLRPASAPMTKRKV